MKIRGIIPAMVTPLNENGINEEGTRKLVRHFGGTSVYLQKEERLLKNQRDKKIIEMFNGCNHKELARHFKLSENRIREIINENLN